MNRFSKSTFHQGLVSVLAVAGALAREYMMLASNSTAPAAEDMDTNAKALAKLDDEWSKAAATKDAKLVASFYAENAVAYPPNEPIAVGRAAAEKVWAAYFADPAFVSISWKTAYAEVAMSGDLGFTAGTYETAFNGPDGKPGIEKGKYLCTWSKQKDGSWKAVHDMWNADAK
jgi:ketosteroid isomerase-like protein